MRNINKYSTINFNEYASKKIKELRKNKGWSQQELANKLNVTQQQINRYENNQRILKKDFLEKLAIAFNVSMNEFYPLIIVPINNVGIILKEARLKKNLQIKDLVYELNSYNLSRIYTNDIIKCIENNSCTIENEDLLVYAQILDVDINKIIKTAYNIKNTDYTKINKPNDDNLKKRLDVVSNLSDKEWELVSKYIDFIKQK